MPKNKLSVQNTVLQSARGTAYNTTITLSNEDYDRLVRALSREDALRRAAYEYVNVVEKGQSPNSAFFESMFQEALGQTKLSMTDFKAEVKKLASGTNISADYLADRVARLVARLED